VYQVILFTNRSLIVWDENDKQCELQGAVDCYEIDQGLLNRLLEVPARYYISKWREWRHEISKREFEYLLGQRTREKDLADLEKTRAAAK